MKFDMCRIWLAVVAILLAYCLITPTKAEGAYNQQVTASVNNAWDGHRVWARSTGITHPFTDVWEVKTTDGRLMQYETGQTTQLTLDDEWRIITLYAVYKGERYVQLSIRAKFRGTTPVFEVIQGDTE